MKHIKTFESIGLPAYQYSGLGKGKYMVTLDMGSDTMEDWAKTLTEFAKIGKI